MPRNIWTKIANFLGKIADSDHGVIVASLYGQVYRSVLVTLLISKTQCLKPFEIWCRLEFYILSNIIAPSLLAFDDKPLLNTNHTLISLITVEVGINVKGVQKLQNQ